MDPRRIRVVRERKRRNGPRFLAVVQRMPWRKELTRDRGERVRTSARDSHNRGPSRCAPLRVGLVVDNETDKCVSIVQAMHSCFHQAAKPSGTVRHLELDLSLAINRPRKQRTTSGVHPVKQRVDRREAMDRFNRWAETREARGVARRTTKILGKGCRNRFGSLTCVFRFLKDLVVAIERRHFRIV